MVEERSDLRKVSEMVERGARAICRAHLEQKFVYGDGYIEEQIETTWDYWTDEARASIQAIHEPTDAMIDAAMAPYVHGIDNMMRDAFRKTIRGYWQAMIKEALLPSHTEHVA